MHPREISEDVALAFDVAHAYLLLVEGIWNLKIVAARGACEAQLISRCGIENERSKEAETVIVVVKFLRFGRHQSDVGARAADAGVPREALGVIAETELAVRRMMA